MYLDKYKICICMCITENIKNYAQYSEKINNQYAIKHGYDFKVFDYTMTDRAPQWCKILVVNTLLESNYYDYLFWIDADAYFNKQEITLESIIKTDINKNIIICKDIVNNSSKYSVALNTGTFFVKTTEWSKNFFKLMWNYKGEYLYKPYHEQTIMEQFLDEDIMDVKNNISIKESTLFNSEINELNSDSINDRFIIHLMAQNKTTRINNMSYWPKYKPFIIRTLENYIIGNYIHLWLLVIIIIIIIVYISKITYRK